MKKLLALILSVIMIMSLMAGCVKNKQNAPADTTEAAAAETEAQAPETQAAASETFEIPETGLENVGTPGLTEEAYDAVALYLQENLDGLSDEVQQQMADAETALADVDSQGLARRHFFHAQLRQDADFTSVDFAPIPHNEILFMQFVDGMWVALEHAVAADGVITVSSVANGPIAIFVDPMGSPTAAPVELEPVLTEESYLLTQIHSMDEIAVLSEDMQQRSQQAKDALQEACPEGFAVKYFFYLDVLEGEGPVPISFMPMDHSEVLLKQFVDGQWVDVAFTRNQDGTLSVDGAVDAPMAVFTK